MTKEELRLIDKEIVEVIYGVQVDFLNQQYGWRVDYCAKDNAFNNPNMTDFGVDGWRLKNYSSSIEHAFELIENLAKSGRAIIMQNDTHETNKVWYVRNFELSGQNDFKNGAVSIMSRGWSDKLEIEIEADTLPLAICRFVLNAKALESFGGLNETDKKTET